MGVVKKPNKEFVLTRTDFTKNSTIGELTLDGKHICYCLEDVVRPAGQKVYSKTAIQAGRYQVIINRSNRFSRLAGKNVLMPLLLNVTGFEGVRIHSGNKAEDTEGCLLTGTAKATDKVGGSRVAYAKLFKMLQTFLDDGCQCWLTIK